MMKLRDWFRRKRCDWFGHQWQETINRAITWVHVFTRKECRRCGLVDEQVTEHPV